jgi:hypothetical protein
LEPLTSTPNIKTNNNKKAVIIKPKMQYFSICLASNKDNEDKIKKLINAKKICLMIKKWSVLYILSEAILEVEV